MTQLVELKEVCLSFDGRSVLDKVERPILSTFSRHDLPLHEVFHLAVRGSSLGEPFGCAGP